MKKTLLFLSCLFFVSTGFAEEHWMITSIESVRNTCLITMDNGTVWKFQEDPGKTLYRTVYQGNGGYSSVPYYVPGRSSNNIKYYQNGDPITPTLFEDHILVFVNERGENAVGCFLEEFEPDLFSSIYEIDPKGYTILMSDGHEWTFSWWQSWASYYWETGDILLPISLTYSTEVINLDRLMRKERSFHASPY